MEKEMVILKNVSRSMGGNQILNHVSLTLDSGKIYGFRGKNGSGKTMLFRAICGLIKIDEGDIIIDGKYLGKDISFPESVGILIENPSFLPNYTGFQNLKMIADLARQISDEQIRTTLQAIGLDPDDKRKYRKYSLGMKQRLGIAQAIMEEPAIILLDEPTNALDTEGVELLKKNVHNLKSKGKTILLASHDLEELNDLSDEIYFVESGKVYKQTVQKGGQ